MNKQVKLFVGVLILAMAALVWAGTAEAAKPVKLGGPGQIGVMATADMDVDGGNAEFDTDDHGGYENYNQLYLNGVNLTATSAFALWDSISEDLDNVESDDYKGLGPDVEDTWSVGNSGIQNYPGPIVGMPSCVGDVAADDGGDPSIPASYTGQNTGVTIRQTVYGGANAPFVIMQFQVYNGSGVTRNLKAAMFNDFDVNDTSSNDGEGYEPTDKLVWEWDDGGYIAGASVLTGSVSNYFLELCCTLSWSDGGYAAQKGFFTGDSSYNGDHSPSSYPSDLEVDIATNIGTLGPGASATVAFAIAGATGGSQGVALTNLKANISAAQACYAQIAGSSVPATSPWSAAALILALLGLSVFVVALRRRAES